MALVLNIVSPWSPENKAQFVRRWNRVQPHRPALSSGYVLSKSLVKLLAHIRSSLALSEE